MKYGTVLRAVRVILIIAIVAMMIVPLVGSIASTNAKEMTAGVESRYDLEEVNDSMVIGTNMIDVNLKMIGKNSYYIGIDDKDPILKSADDAPLYIYEQKVAGAKVASIYDSNKEICKQPSIQYHNGITTTVITGMKLPDNVMGLASFSVSMSLVNGDVNFDIPFGSSYIQDGYILLKTEIPDIVMFLVNSFDYTTAVKVNVTVAGVASFYVNLDMETHHSVTATVDSVYHMTFKNAAIGAFAAQVGDGLVYTYDLNTWNIELKHVSPTDKRPLSESIELDKDTGNIVVYYYDEQSTTEPTKGYIDGKYYDGIVNILKYLEDTVHV